MQRSPFLSDFVTLRDAVDQLVNQSFRTPWARGGAGGGGAVVQAMPLDLYATDERAVLLAAVPGMRPEDLELSVHQNTVSLGGTVGSVPDAEEANGATWYVHELASGAFRRSVTLPFPIDPERVEAGFAQGILKVVLPKAESAKPTKIAVHGGQGQAIGAVHGAS